MRKKQWEKSGDDYEVVLFVGHDEYPIRCVHHPCGFGEGGIGMTRYEVYNEIAKFLGTGAIQDNIGEDRGLSERERQVLEQSVLEVINALNFCIRYNWPINTYFKERKQHESAD